MIAMKNLCSIKSGSSDTQDATRDGPYAFFDRSKSVKKSDQYLFDCEALIIPGEGTDFLPRHFCGKFDLHQRAYALHNFSESIHPRFLFYFLVHKKEYFARVAVGATVKSLRLRHFQDLPVAVTTLRGQERIVAILDQAFEAIANIEQNTLTEMANADAVFANQLDSTLLTESGDWRIATLSQVCQIARGGSPRPIEAFITDGDDGINWVKISDATASEKYIYKTEQRILPAGARRSRMVHDGDFLLSNSMSFGRPYIMKTEGCVHDGWLVLSNYQTTLDQDFLYLILGSGSLYRQFDRLAAGSTVRNLNKDLASRVILRFPGLERQRVLAGSLEHLRCTLDGMTALLRKKLAALKALRHSLLHQAFSGNL